MRLLRSVRPSLLLALLGMSLSCILSPQPDPPGGSDGDREDATTRPDAGPEEAGGDVTAPDADADADGDATADDWAWGDAPDAVDGVDDWCATDPDDGPTGEPCEDGEDCDPGFTCLPQYQATDPSGSPWTDYAGGYCVPEAVPGDACSPEEPGSCPGGARCVRFGPVGPAGVPQCLDACSATDADGRFHPTNCDCRNGYRCDRSFEVCVPGCLTNEDCCVTWVDADADGVRQYEELSSVEGCVAACDRLTFECVFAGDADARVGDACLHGSQCAPGARCWMRPGAERRGTPGVCLVERCDAADRPCPEGSACVADAAATGFAGYCGRPCSTGAAPGAEGSCPEGLSCTAVSFAVAVDGDGACLPPPEE
jgi:hypothetical protein